MAASTPLTPQPVCPPWPLVDVPQADIASDGVFKYVLMKIEFPSGSTSHAVAGYVEAEFHDDCLKRYRSMYAAGLAGCTVSCSGGGRIAVDARAQKLQVYGYSMGYGLADHALSVAILKAAMPSFSMSWTNDGY